jgi:hypothetical protein
MPAYNALKDAQDAAGGEEDNDKKMWAWLPGICACVEKWELQGLGQLSPETFPASPRTSSWELFGWLHREIVALVMEADELPNS